MLAYHHHLQKLPRNNCDASERAWNLLRLALLWARKGGMLIKKRLVMELCLVPKFLKSFGHANHRGRSQMHYGERELSFDKTPIFHVKMRRPAAAIRFHVPRFPCMNPEVDFDCDNFDDDEEVYEHNCGRKSFLMGEEEAGEEMVPREEEEIDLRAEKFITQFYEQMKLQRQISHLQYNEMLSRGTN